MWETGTNGGIPNARDDPAVVVIEPSLGPTPTPCVSSVDDHQRLPARRASSSLKDVTGFDDPDFTGGPYPVDRRLHVRWARPSPGSPSTSSSVPGVPTDASRRRSAAVCTVTETDDLGATTVTYDPANADGTAGEVTVPSEEGATVSIGITNDFPFGAFSC